MDLLPLVKYRGGVEKFLSIFMKGPHIRYENNGRRSGRFPSISSGGKKINKAHEQNIRPCFALPN